MLYHQLIVLAALATTTLGSSLTSRQASVCDQQRLTCGAAPGANQSLCASQKSACDACEAAYESYITSPGSNKSLAASLRNECFAASTVGDGTGVDAIIAQLKAAQAGGATATPTLSPSSTTTAPPESTTQASTCDQQRLECGSAPGANQSLCAVQKNSCDACEAAYEAYVTSPGSNKSLAASLRNECFAASKVGTGDGVAPIIASLSTAQAGGASATPTAAVSESSSTLVGGSTEPAPTTTVTYVNPAGPSSVAPTDPVVAPSTLASAPVEVTTRLTPTSSTPAQFTGAASNLKPVGVVGILALGAALML